MGQHRRVVGGTKAPSYYSRQSRFQSTPSNKSTRGCSGKTRQLLNMGRIAREAGQRSQNPDFWTMRVGVHGGQATGCCDGERQIWSRRDTPRKNVSSRPWFVVRIYYIGVSEPTSEKAKPTERCEMEYYRLLKTKSDVCEQSQVFLASTSKHSELRNDRCIKITCISKPVPPTFCFQDYPTVIWLVSRTLPDCSFCPRAVLSLRIS